MKAKKTILKNGLRIISVPMKDNPTATVLVLVEAGSKYESKDINGISHFLEHLCFKGTTKRPTPLHISQELDGLGSQFNAFTGHELTGYYAKAEAGKLPKLVDIISDLYLNPILPEDEIEKEKGVIVDEISMYEDMPQRDVLHVYMDLLYGDQPAGWNIAGTKELVRSMTREEIVSYRAKHYVAPRTTVIVAGSFDEKKTMTLLEKKFAAMPTGNGGKKKRVVEDQTKPALAIKGRDTDQTHLVLGVRTFGQKSKMNPSLRLLAGVLGDGMSSRLFQRIRVEMGVGYYVQAGNEIFTDHGALSIMTGVSNERIVDVTRAIIEEMERLKHELVSEEELKKVKDHIAGGTYLGLESSDSVAEYYGIAEILGRPLKTPKQKISDLREVTPADIRKAAKKVFVNDRLNAALVGPAKNTQAIKRALKFKS